MTNPQINLTKGFSALVSPSDLEIVSKYKWYASCFKNKTYAATRVGQKTIYMHRLILGIHEKRDGFVVDHINHDGLDNTRENLKLCSRSENLRNRRDRRHYLDFANVSKQRNGWVAKIMHMGKEIYLGYFDSEREAGIAYASAEKVILTAFGRA